MLSCSNGFRAKRDVKLVGHRDNDCLDLRVGEHFVIVPVGDAWAVNGRHFREQILSDVTDGIEFCIAGLAAGVEMGELSDGAAAKNADTEEARFFLHAAASG